MNDNLTPAQVTQYYKEQTNQTNPLSPKEWLKSQTIDSSKLTPTTPIQLPPAQPDTTNYSAVTQAAASLAPATTTYQTPEQTASQDYKNAQANQGVLVNNLTNLYGQITGREAYQAQQEADLGINQQQKNLQELTNQLNAIKTEGTLTPLKIQSEFAGRGATAGGVAPIESARNRENAIQALTVGAQIQAVQGNLTLAVEQAKRATDLKYGPLEKEIEMKERQLKLLNDYVLSPLEQERKAQQELALQAQKDKLASQKASESDFNENMLIAQQAGMTNLEALEARRLFEAGRIDEANGIIAQYGTMKNLPASAQEYEYAKKQGYTGSYTQYQNEDANRKAVIQRASAQGLPYQVVSQIDKLSSSFDSSPIVKQYNEVQNKKLSVDAIVNSGVKGPADLALVFEFMKALDPTSVVRESEYETASKSGNIFQGAYARFNGYFKAGGGFLPPSVRSDFQTLIDKKFSVATQQYQNLKNETTRKINLKTGMTDGADYLTSYEGAVTQGGGNANDPLGLF